MDGLITAIVRPVRATYTSIELGPTRIRYGDIEYIREDFQVENCRGLRLQASVWYIMNKEYENNETCLIYLHPNSGSRIDVIKNARIMSIAAHTRCNVCSFDFGGCGESDGDCISLGVREKEDVCAIMSYLLANRCRRFILWGRSMGAATAIMFYGAYKELLVGTVIALILDSPFTSLQGIATEYSQTRSVPGLLLSPALQYLRHNISSQYGFDINSATPIAATQRVNIPAIVLSGGEDKTVPPVLSEEVYKALSGPKMRIFFQGTHNSKRPVCIYDVLKFFLPGVLKGLPINDLLVNSADILKKDLIPDKDIHGIPKEDLENNHEGSTPTEETCLLDEQKASSSSVTCSHESAASSPSSILSPTSTSTSQNQKCSPTSIKRKGSHLNKSPSSNGTHHHSKGTEKLNPMPWNQKEVFRENHSYGINHNHNHHLHTHTHNLHGTQRRSAVNTTHPHLHTHNNHNNNHNRHHPHPLHPHHLNPNTHHHHSESKHNRKATQPTIYSVTYEKIQSVRVHLAIPSEESIPSNNTSINYNSVDWMGVIGSLFWGPSPSPTAETSPPSPSNGFQRPVSYGGSPAGSLGYLLHHLESDVCPPESSAWESVLLARAIEDITDAVLAQILPLAVGLIEVSIEDEKNKSTEFTNPHKAHSYGTQIFQQVSSDLGLVSADLSESQAWATLLFLSPRELFTLIQDKEQEQQEQEDEQQEGHELEEDENEEEEYQYDENENEKERTTSEDKSGSCSSGNSLDDCQQQSQQQSKQQQQLAVTSIQTTINQRNHEDSIYWIETSIPSSIPTPSSTISPSSQLNKPTN